MFYLQRGDVNCYIGDSAEHIFSVKGRLRGGGDFMGGKVCIRGDAGSRLRKILKGVS